MRPTVDEILGANGQLAAADGAGFEVRDGQLEMARLVARTLEDGGLLLVEAGTGTGKTLAYLAAAVAVGRRVVVSTATRALQDQILRKDLPRLLAAFGERGGEGLVAAVLKGRANYLCLLRLDQARALPAARRPRALPLLERWADRTETGDRAEVDGLPEDHPIWAALTTTSETCLGGRCPLYARCWVTRARALAEAADVVVVNHHLYFGDAAVRAAGGQLLPEHDAVVFDEAHAVPEIAAQFFGRHVSTLRLAHLVKDLDAALDAAPDGLPGRGALPVLARAIVSGSEDLFAAIRPGDLLPPPTSGGQSARTVWSPEVCEPAATDAHLALDTALLALREAVTKVGDAPGAEALALFGPRVATLQEDLALLLEPRLPGWVFFREARGDFVSLTGQPISAADPLRKHALASVDAAIFTSATLTVAGDFGFIRRRLGLELEELDGRPVAAVSFASPFDFAEQARLYLPAGLPPPDAPGFIEALEAHVRALTALTHGRAFVLFTSHRALDALHERLAGTLPFPLLRQGDAPRTALIERFRETPNAVLLGTGTFWEGVDVSGDALSLVIIDKLPFESPGDPVLQARLEQHKAEGGNPFTGLQVPAAALALKQGFGRLIRSRTDRGIVAVMDARLTTKGYGKRMRESLPPAPVVTDFGALTRWWTRQPP